MGCHGSFAIGGQSKSMPSEKSERFAALCEKVTELRDSLQQADGCWNLPDEINWLESSVHQAEEILDLVRGEHRRAHEALHGPKEG